MRSIVIRPILDDMMATFDSALAETLMLLATQIAAFSLCSSVGASSDNIDVILASVPAYCSKLFIISRLLIFILKTLPRILLR